MTLQERLSPRQREILAFIKSMISVKGVPPTLREIGARFGIRSTRGVNDHLVALEAKGAIVRVALKSRSIRLVGSTCPHCHGTGRIDPA